MCQVKRVRDKSLVWYDCFYSTYLQKQIYWLDSRLQFALGWAGTGLIVDEHDGSHWGDEVLQN